jgi:hypothetical protein
VLVDDPPRFVVIQSPTRGEVRRAGTYQSLTAQLRSGRISPTAFRRRVSRWAPIAGHGFLADPDAVLAIIEARRAADDELFIYQSGRST